jgi:hypothetical protein
VTPYKAALAMIRLDRRGSAIRRTGIWPSGILVGSRGHPKVRLWRMASKRLRPVIAAYRPSRADRQGLPGRGRQAAPVAEILGKASP